MVDRYGTDVLVAGRGEPRSTEHPVELGMVVEDAQTGYVGAVVRVEYGRIDLEDRHGRARVDRASRIYVEGRHDAELVAQVWGEDMRIEGLVVEHLGGVDDLVGIVAEFEPGLGRRLGVLIDHRRFKGGAHRRCHVSIRR